MAIQYDIINIPSINVKVKKCYNFYTSKIFVSRKYLYPENIYTSKTSVPGKHVYLENIHT